MAAARWRTRPNLDPSRFTVFQRGGYWYASPKSPAAAASSPAAAAGTPTSPAALPVDALQEAGIDDYANRIAALPGAYNARRESAATLAGRSLTDQGLADIGDVVTTSSTGQGNTYGVAYRGEGQATRDALSGQAAAFNSRGTFASTARDRAQRQDRQRIANARDALLRSLQGQQQDLVAQQQSEQQGLSGEQRAAQVNYAQWRSDQQASVAGASTPAAVPQPEQPAPGEALSAPATQYVRSWRRFARATPRLAGSGRTGVRPGSMFRVGR